MPNLDDFSVASLREELKPFSDRAIALGGAGTADIIHSIGRVMGVNAVDTLQPEAANMEPCYPKEHLGGRLSFHGCISTAT